MTVKLVETKGKPVGSYCQKVGEMSLRNGRVCTGVKVVKGDGLPREDGQPNEYGIEYRRLCTVNGVVGGGVATLIEGSTTVGTCAKPRLIGPYDGDLDKGPFGSQPE